MGMSADEERLLATAPARWRTRITGRELLAQGALAAGFVAAAAVLVAELGDGEVPRLAPAIALTLAFTAVSRVRFPAGAGFTVPTQIVFVPMLFVVPPVWAPVLAGAAMTLGRLPAVLFGGQHVTRILAGPGNAWFALGPALVFALADVGAPDPADWPVYLLALAAQFLVDYAIGAAGEWISLGVAPELQLRVMLPIWQADLLLSPLGLLAAFATVEQPYAFLLVLPLASLLPVSARERRARIDQTVQLSSAHRNTALLLGEVIGGDDEYTGEHSRGVVELALQIAEEMGLGEDERRLVEFGALLHDVGKIAIPKEIINKRGPLDDREWQIVRTHTVVGQRMLDPLGGVLSEVGRVVRSSHERYDGGGYPDGLAGTAIPRASRIVSVADAYNAMTTTRPYRAGRSRAEALAELQACSGAQFDPAVTRAAIAVLAGAPPAPEPAPLPALGSVAAA